MENKPLLQSKIFWLSVIGILMVVIGTLIKRPYDPVTGQVEEGIVDAIFAEPFNLVSVLLNVLVILMRWLFTNTKIQGIG
jgi:hypothetical protein